MKKPKKKTKLTPEEALRNACGAEMGLELTYNEIKDRLDTAEIARVGAVRQASAQATPAAPPRHAAPAVLLVLAVLILTPAVAVGSFLIARSAVEPPTMDTDETASRAETESESKPTDIPPVTDGSFSTELYDVIDIDGLCYLSFHPDAMLSEDTEKDPSCEEGAIYFSSMDDLYRSFSTGTLTGQQIRVIQSAFRKTEYGYLIPHIQSLKMPLMPEGCTTGGVSVIEDQYEIDILSPMASSGMSFCDEGRYRALLAYEYTDYYENDNLYGITLTEGEYDGISCEIGDYSTSAAALRTVRFRVESEGKTLSVRITYRLESFREDSSLSISDTVPSSAEIFCEQNGQYSIVYLSDIQTHLPIEWLTSFGITDYQVPDTEPAGSVSPLSPDEVTGLSDTLFDLNGSYATENGLNDPDRSHYAEHHTLFLRMDHLPAEIAEAEQPAKLWVEEYDLWQSLFPDLASHTNESYSVLDVSLSNYDDRFFENHSLLILFTEGRSGSVRYRLENTAANHEYVKVTLTAGVPAANTMDIAYWCVMIPVAKPKSGETNRPVYLETQDVPMDSFEEFVTLSPEVYRGLWFWSSRSGSYERDGYLYGRISHNEAKGSWDFPCAEAVTSFEEWQAIYGGYVQYDPSVYPLHQGFQEGIDAIDEDFFEQKSLAVVYVDAWSGSHHHRVEKVMAQDGSLHIQISNLCSPAGDDDMGYWAILIPIDKDLDALPLTVERGEVYPSWEEWDALPENQYWAEWYGE